MVAGKMALCKFVVLVRERDCIVISECVSILREMSSGSKMLQELRVKYIDPYL